MDSDNLRALVEDFKEKGNSDESIVKLLVAAGYDEGKIRECLGQNNQPPALNNGEEEVTDPAPVSHRFGRGWPLMRGFGSLFNGTVEIFKERIWVMAGIYVFPILISGLVVSPLIVYFSKNPTAGSGVAMGTALLVLVLLNAFAGLGIVYSLKDKLNIVQSYIQAWKGILNYYWILLLSFLIGFGGLLLGIIPVFIFSIWFVLAVYTYVFQGQKGISALLRSKEYVTNYWWEVFWRLFLLGIIFWVANVLVRLIGSLIPEVGIVLAYLLQLATFPFVIVFEYLIFRNLTEIKPELAEAKVSGRRGFFVFSAWLGLAVVAAGIWAGIVFIAPVLLNRGLGAQAVPNSPTTQQLKSNVMDSARIHNVSSIAIFLEIYFNTNGRYPSATTWPALQSEFHASLNAAPQIVPVSPDLGYCYNSLNGGNSYVVGAKLEYNNSLINQTLQGVKCGSYTCGVSNGSYVYCLES